MEQSTTSDGPPKSGARTLARRGAVMATGVLVSRVTGFGRNAVVGAGLGAGLVSDVYATPVMLPGSPPVIRAAAHAADLLTRLIGCARTTRSIELADGPMRKEG